MPLPGGLGHLARRRLMHPKTLAPPLPLVLRLRTRSLNPNPPLRRRPARFPFTSASIARAQSYGLGGFSYGSTVVLPQGSTVYDALCATGASISGSSYYVSAINGLAEKQCGNGSGWTYAVNGSFPGKACGRYTLSGGESISWIYSTEKNPTMAM